MIFHEVGFVDTLHKFLRLPLCMKRLDSKP